VPLGETMLAHRLLAEAGLAPPDEGPIAVVAAPGTAGHLGLQREAGGWRLAGGAERVPWGRCARAVAVVAEAGPERLIALAETAGCTIAHGTNLALEPRDTLGFDLHLSHSQVRPGSVGPGDVKLMGAALRSLAMAGAMERVLELTAGYVGERVQFGRALSKLQAVQQSMAVLAGQVASARAAADLAAEALAGIPSLARVAAAKICTGEAAGIAAGIAHQLHGAIGFSFEHILHFHTRRLWAWRDEHGGEAEWSRALGTEVLGLDADELWPFLTAA
jgi:acyl-CoA dehydrogenase